MSDEARLAAVLEVRLDRVDQRLADFNRKLGGALKKAAGDIDTANDNWAKIFGKKPDLAKALDGVIDNTRLKVLDSGVARVGLLGSALENLGPYGLAAAAGIGALAGAMSLTRQAAQFGDEIGDTAERLHVTTDALQEYRYAVRAAGGEEKGADEALEKFSITLGKAQSGATKAQKPFKQLGFTTEQIKSFDTVEKGLKAVTDRIGNLKSNVQKDAVIDLLGLTSMKPAIEDGSAALERLRKEARDLGVVMDAGMIKRAGEANDKFETLEQIISIQLKQAFVDLAPVLEKLLGLAAQLVRSFADVTAEFQKMQNRSDSALADKEESLKFNLGIARGAPIANTALGRGNVQFLEKQLAEVQAERARRAQAKDKESEDTKNKPGKNLINQAEIDKAREQARASAALIDDATRQELAARRALVKGLFDQATLQAQEVDAELKRQTDRIRADREEGKITKAAADRATTLLRKAADEKKAAIASDLTTKLEQDRLSKSQELAGVLDATTQIYISLQGTIAERRKAELKLLEKQHTDRLQALYVRRDQAGREGRTDDVAFINRLIDAENDNYGLARKDAEKRNADPLQAWLDRAPKSIAQLNERLQELQMQGLDQLNAGLADAIVNSKSLGDAAGNVFRQLEVQILQMLFEAGERRALAFLGFASGGLVRGPGSGTSDSIPARLSNGEFVVNAEATGKHRQLLEAINAGRVPMLAAGGLVGRMPSISAVRPIAFAGAPLTFDLRGAVVTEDLLAQMNQAIAASEGRAINGGARGGAALSQMRLNASAANRLGFGGRS